MFKIIVTFNTALHLLRTSTDVHFSHFVAKQCKHFLHTLCSSCRPSTGGSCTCGSDSEKQPLRHHNTRRRLGHLDLPGPPHLHRLPRPVCPHQEACVEACHSKDQRWFVDRDKRRMCIAEMLA